MRAFQPPARQRDSDSDRFDPVREGERHGLTGVQSLAIWQRAREDATDGEGRCDQAQARLQFHARAARLAVRGGRMRVDAGKLTRAEILYDDSLHRWLVDDTAPRAPGRETLVIAEARRWRAFDDAHASAAPASPPGAPEVAAAIASLRRLHGTASQSAETAPRSAADGASNDALGHQVETAQRSASQPLHASLRPALEHALGQSLDDVRVHTSTPSDDVARRVGAIAYSWERHIHFRSGEYDPDSRAGQALIAHEVFHAAAARGQARSGPITPSDAATGEERLAAEFAHSFDPAWPIAGVHVPARASGGPNLFRETLRHDDRLPSTGIGLLDSEYTRGERGGSGHLVITLRIFMEFGPQWDDLERRAYQSNYRSLVETFWSRRFQLQRGTGPRRERADVDVRVEFVDRDACDFLVAVQHVDPATRTDAQRDYVHRGRSTDLRERDPVNHQPVPGAEYVPARAYDEETEAAPDFGFAFPPLDGSAPPDAQFSLSGPHAAGDRQYRAYLRRLIAAAQASPSGGIEVRLHGFAGPAEAGSAGDTALRHAEQVRDRLNQLLIAQGRSLVEQIRFVAVPETLSSGPPRVEAHSRWAAQSVAVHESGHMMGLGDEYPEPQRGRPAGDPALHSALAERMNFAPVIVGSQATGGSIMASGTHVMRHHYVVFAEEIARLTMTDVSQWSIVEARRPER